MAPMSPAITRPRMAHGEVDVVMVPRERYSPTVACVRGLLATVPVDTRIILVRGGIPDRTVRDIIALGANRVKVIGPKRHLAPNTARAIGLRFASARFVAFVDNDVLFSPGWLEALTETARIEDAWVVRPNLLQRFGDRVTVHDSGGDCHIVQRGTVTSLIESHRHLGLALSEIGLLQRERVEMFEFHAVLFNRERLVALGGPDERMLSQGEHLDLALRVRAAGGSVWLEPSAEITYVISQRLTFRDLVFFLGRWSPSWNIASREAFCTKHAVNDPEDPYETWLFGELHRSTAWLPVGRFAARVARHPIDHAVAKRFDRYVGRYIAEVARRRAPRWHGNGSEVAA